MTRKRRQRNREGSDRALKAIYYDTKHPAGFGGKQKLTTAAKSKNIKTGDVSSWLAGSTSYTLHKPTRKRFRRRKIIVSGINSLWQSDLTDVQRLRTHNAGYKYILFTIDIFSRKATAVPLKSKSTNAVKDGFEETIRLYEGVPHALQTDKGTEFLGKDFQQMLKRYKIHHYVSENHEIKASAVERLQRTIKTKMYRYFTHSGSYTYIDALQQLMDGYNESPHRVTGMKPNDINYQNQESVWQKLYNDNDYKGQTSFLFMVGDRVRISKYSAVFKKGYSPNWSEELFTISQRHYTEPPVYSLKDDSGTQLKGVWYEKELQKAVVVNETYRVEKILATRKHRGKTQYLVRWAGYPPSFDSYVNKSDLITSYKN